MTEEVVISQIAVVVSVALASGILLHRLKQPDIVGYVLTGVLLGPSVFGLISSRDQVSILAELGVLMLLFVLGLKLDLQTFRKNFSTSVFCVSLQIAAGLGISWFVSLFFNWPPYFTVALGFILALSSTAVVVNILDSFNVTTSSMGSKTVGILIAQDIAAVPMILTLKALTGSGGDWRLPAKVISSVAFMALFLYCLGQLQKSRQKISLTRWLGDNKDLYRLASLSLCFAAAAIAGGAGLTPPYGAFLAGLTLGNLTDRNDEVLAGIQPIQKILLLVFFLSTGLLLDLRFVWHHFWTIALLLLIVTLVKTVGNIAILRVLRVDLVQASFMGVAMAQLGEFAFLLITALEKQPDPSFEFAEKCLIALTVLSLMFSPFWFKTAQKLNRIRISNDMSIQKLWNLVFGKTVLAAKENLAKTWETCERVSKTMKKRLNKTTAPAAAPAASTTPSNEPAEPTEMDMPATPGEHQKETSTETEVTEPASTKPQGKKKN